MTGTLIPVPFEVVRQLREILSHENAECYQTVGRFNETIAETLDELLEPYTLDGKLKVSGPIVVWTEPEAPGDDCCKRCGRRSCLGDC